MAFVFFAQTMFGILIAIRILRKFRDRSLISTTCLTKIGTAFALLTSFLPFPSPRLSFFVVIFALIALKIFLNQLEMRRIETLLAHFPRFLDHWLLGLRVGQAPSVASESALLRSESAFQSLVRPLLYNNGASVEARRHLFLRERILLELHLAQTQGHNTVARLESLREFLRRESDFRRKSGQALRQASIQSTVMLALHFALCAFVIHRSGWGRSADLIVTATALTLAGMLVLRLVARRIKWSM